MQRQLLLHIAICFSLSAAAQNVGINNPTPNASALLDLTSTDKGLLVPRMTTVQRDLIPAPATSLLIFNTANTRYEYFDGLAWVPLVSSGWSLSGNAGTNTATNFLGTTDAQPLAFRTNGVERMRIGSGAMTTVGINTTTPGHTLHVRFTLPNNINSAVMVETNQGTSATNIGFRNSVTTNFSSLGMQSNGDFGLGLGCNFGGCAFGTEAFRVKANGNFGIGTANAQDRLHVVGNIRMVDGNQAAGRVLVSDANGAASWQVLTTTSTNAWGLIGNAGTGAANFLGTTDDQALRFRVNNLTAGFISTATTGSVAFGLLAAQAGGGGNSVIIGFMAGRNTNSFSLENTYLGSEAGRAHVIGNFNTYLGAGSGISTVSGTANTAVGRLSGAWMSGAVVGNTFVGADAGRDMNTGSRNTAIGTNTRYGSGALTNSTAIGADAQVDQINSMVLGSVAGVNGAGATIRVGIGTTAPVERLHVVGNFRMVGRSLFSNGFSADNAALLYRDNTDYMFLGPQSGSSANGGAIALFGSTNVAGGNANGIDMNVPGGSVRLNHTNGSFVFRTNSTSGYLATMELNDVGYRIGHNSTGRDINFVNGNGERLRITPTGNNLTAGGSWGVLSDRRVKSDIRAMDYGLQEVLAMQPVRYFHHDTEGFDHRPGELSASGKSDIGFIAQDLHTIVPEVVVAPADENTSLWAVTYERLVPVLVKAIQEQQVQIDALREELELMRKTK